MNDLLSNWSEWLPELFDGYKFSIQICTLALLWGVPVGLMLAIGTDSKTKLLRIVSICLVELGRGAPVLILLQFFYFGLPNAHVSLSSAAASILALGWSTAAYTSEIIRGGLKAVPAGQREAAVTLGLPTMTAMRIVIIPQAMRICLPPLLGFAMVMLQTTSLCFTIALPELVARANDIGSASFQYMSVLMLTGLMYAAVCIPATVITSQMEKRLSKHI
ncbi:amino acid ABC transporter permease [Pseudomonas rhodesiae]|jgi:polar amino acid transport system permease protein|uniref:amino acid ABC transporter permease n=1 Tax=Pseudomonas rhodesiae TaxID=76760 RepID=UPI000F45F112|nr:amino acid ABC transporter permease [Pseudomonas rhodesiae]ROM50868.1 amino acid ABC transporter permease [Pseudomonas rhodesiae]ROM61371.1 amino acid ABC transporter permease [Pseudomonas rhodesiae]